MVPRALPDPAGPLSSDLLLSDIAEASTAVNNVQQAKTKKRGLHVKYDENINGSTHFFLVRVDKNKFSEIFVLIQTNSVG